MFRQDHYSRPYNEDNNCYGDGFRDKFERWQDRFFERGAGFGRGGAPEKSVPVNIEEHPSFFEVKLFGAGRSKEGFQVAIEEDVLTISYKESPKQEKASFIYKEFEPSSFTRSFQLQQAILKENIQASFEDGILTIILPKDPENTKSVQDVPID